MSKSCTILAHVRRPNGEIVESRLFKDLLHYISNNRELAKEYYAVGTSEEFLTKAREYKEFQMDENGEITFNSLRTLAKIDIENDKLLQVLNKDIGEGEYSYEEAVRRIENFNANNIFADKVLATMFPSASGKYYVAVVPQKKTVTDIHGRKKEEGVNTSDERQKLHDTVRNEELERKIKELLRRHRVDIGFLEGNRKEGRYSTENAVKTSEGLYTLIHLSRDGYTTDVLAEEAGHFAVGALGDNPLVHRIEGLLESPEVQREALGDEEFENSNLGNNPKREVAGRLVGKALQRKLDNNGTINVLANRIANLAKRIFYRFTGNEVRWTEAKAEQIANKIAYGFVEGEGNYSVENAISITETMHDATLTVNQKVYRDAIDELGRMTKQLEAIAEDQFAGMSLASLAVAIHAGTNTESGESALQIIDHTADSFAFDGIVQTLVQIFDYLGPGGEIEQMLSAVNFDNPADYYANMARNGRYLRQARTFLRSAEIIINIIDKALQPHNEGGVISMPNGSTLTDVRYQDENGTWKSINLKSAIPAYKAIITKAVKGIPGVDGLETLEQAYFARFCEDVYGSKYITTSVGKIWGKNVWSGESSEEEIISISDMVTGEGMDDIDIFHRYLGSMANNPDIIGQITDKLVKTANKNADDLTLKYQERLIVLKDRAKKLGLDTSDLAELDENGVPTGNLITPPPSHTENGDREEDAIYDAYMGDPNIGESIAVHYGSWEKAREEFRRKAWEKFKEKNPDWSNMTPYVRGLKWDKFLRNMGSIKIDGCKSMKEWNAANSVKVEVKDPKTNEVLYVKWVPNKIYQSDQWEKLKQKYPDKNGESLEKWIYDYRKIKEELDSMLPVGSTVSYRLPQFKGTFMNSLRNAKALEKGRFKNANAWRKTFGRRVVLESFVETSEDTDYGDMSTMNSSKDELLGTRLNYEAERAARLPVFGINKLQNMQDLSTDLFHSTLAYASMATSYKFLDSVVDALEVGAEALHNRNIRGKETWAEAGMKKLGSTWRKKTGAHETRATGAMNRAYGRYLKYLEKQVYGISATHWGIPIWKGKRILLNKVIQNLSSLGGSLFLKGNVLGGSVNTLTGFNNIFKEALTADYFDAKDWAFAHKYYFKHLPQLWTPGDLRKDDKLHLFLAEMNASSNNREKFRNWHTNRAWYNNFYRALGYLPYSSGDHYMQAMSYLSVAHGTKLYDINGNVSSNLWDAYETTHSTIDLDETEINMGKKNSLTFKKFCPFDASRITSARLNEEGVYLKPAEKSTIDFEDWLAFQDERFANEAYRKDRAHADEYNDYRKKYYSMSDEELMKFRAEKYKTLASILQKVEDYTSNPSPLVAVPSFTPEEQKYINIKKIEPKYRDLGTGNYSNLLQAVRDDIYNVIWTKADESAYMDKCREINDRLHGIYNEQDKTAWHQQWYTNAFLAMKGWALGYLEQMYSNSHYSIALGKNVEGFINTAAKIHFNWLSGFFGNKNSLSTMDMVISMFAPWHKKSRAAMQKAGFSEEQNMNARRMFLACALITFLYVLKLATAPPDKDEQDDVEMDATTGLVYYFAMRTLLEQQALIWAPEMFIQSGQLMDFMPVGGAALWDIGKLGYEGVGAALTPDTNKEFYWPRSDKNGKYEEHDPRFLTHLERIVPYWKSYWSIMHPYEAAYNYEFGRKLRTR